MGGAAVSTSPGERSNAALAHHLDEIEQSLVRLIAAVRTVRSKVEGRNPAWELMQVFDGHWRSLYAVGDDGLHYKFQAKDGAAFKRLLNSDPRPSVWNTRITRYFLDVDPFLVNAKHPVGLMLARLNRYTTDAMPVLPSAQRGVADCFHEPRCTTDIQHTKQRGADLRALRR